MKCASIINSLIPNRLVTAACIAAILMAPSAVVHAFNAGHANNSCAGCHGNANPGLTVRATANGAAGNAITLNQGGTLGMVLSIASGATAAQTSSGFSAAIYGAGGGNLITLLSGSTPGAQILGGAYLTHTSRGAAGPLTRSFSVTIPTALPPGSYTVKSLMLAANGDGGPGGDQWNTSSDEIALTVQAAAGSPGAPTIGTATAGNQQISVAFTPASGGSPATSYQAACGVWSGTGANSPVLVPVSNGQAVTCNVTASNNSGTSIASAASNSVTANNNPGAPTGVLATADNGQVSLSFTAPANTGGVAIRGYAATCGPRQGFSTAPTTTITVGGLSNGTPVTCTVTATNTANATSPPSVPSNSVTPAGPPEAPTGVNISAVGNAQLSLTFAALGSSSNGGSPITGYTATCVGITPTTGTQSVTGTSPPLTILGLSNGGNYGCFVTATNAVATGAQSSRAFGSPRAPTPPGAPTGVTALAGNSQVSVAFTAIDPANTGGAPVTSYTATCTGLASGIDAQPASGTSSPLTVTGLANGTGYRCTVTATNAAGTGVASSRVFATPIGPTTVPPSAPTIGPATAGNAMVTVNFTPGNDGGATITGYTATCGSQTAVGTASSLTVTGLNNGTPYNCSVTATNSAGTGPASGLSNSVTPVAPVVAPSLPGAPVIGTAIAGVAAITVPFTAPDNIGRPPIIDYLMPCYTAAGVLAGPPVMGPASPLTMTGLAPGTEYKCRVGARNSAGFGPVSADSNSVAPLASATSAPGTADIVFLSPPPTVTPAAVVAGGQVRLVPATQSIMMNRGTTATGPFRVGVYLSTDAVITAADTFLNFGSHDFNIAAGAQTSFATITVTIPPGTPPGNYFIGILADDTNRVSESNKNNNYVSAPIAVTPNPAAGRADLMFVSSSLTVTPTAVGPGGAVRLSSSAIKNQGTVASGPFRFGVYLSTDPVITTADTFLNFASTEFNLAAGAEQGFGGVNVTIPPGTPLGSYYIGILVDDTNKVNEANENNNYVSVPITIRK